jgi:hypothetical protein
MSGVLGGTRRLDVAVVSAPRSSPTHGPTPGIILADESTASEL